MTTLSTGERGAHKGICADVSRLNYGIADVPTPQKMIVESEERKNKFWLMLCCVGDPHNLGSIVRTAYYLGVDEVFVTNAWDSHQATAPITPVTSRASSGVIELFTPHLLRNPTRFLEELRLTKGTI